MASKIRGVHDGAPKGKSSSSSLLRSFTASVILGPSMRMMSMAGRNGPARLTFLALPHFQSPQPGEYRPPAPNGALIGTGAVVTSGREFRNGTLQRPPAFPATTALASSLPRSSAAAMPSTRCIYGPIFGAQARDELQHLLSELRTSSGWTCAAYWSAGLGEELASHLREQYWR